MSCKLFQTRFTGNRTWINKIFKPKEAVEKLLGITGGNLGGVEPPQVLLSATIYEINSKTAAVPGAPIYSFSLSECFDECLKTY